MYWIIPITDNFTSRAPTMKMINGKPLMMPVPISKGASGSMSGKAVLPVV